MKQPLFGIRISELRTKKGLTQKALAEACNVDIRTIQRIESGEVLPRLYTVNLLSKALDVDISGFHDKLDHETETNRQLRLPFLGAVIFSINCVPVVFQIATRPFGFYIYEFTILVHIVAFIFFYKGFYFLAKQSANHVLSTSVLLSMVLIPLLNVTDLFKDNFFIWGNVSTVFTATCINAFFVGIGFLIESKRKTYGSILYKTAGIMTFIQTSLFFSLNFHLIVTGLVISIFCNVIMTYILYIESANLKNQWKTGVRPV